MKQQFLEMDKIFDDGTIKDAVVNQQ